MNYQSHLNTIKKQILSALTYDKKTLIENFSDILKKSSELLKSQNEPFSFWLQELNVIDPQSIPITNHAISDCVKSWIKYTPSRPTLAYELERTCEKLFTYWECDDLCTYQTQFYFYKNKVDDTVFKSSGFGATEFMIKHIDFENDFKLGIALIHDLEKVVILRNLY